MNAAWNTLSAAWSELSLATSIALVAWVLATVSLPVIRWIWGDRALRWDIALGVVLQAATVVTALSTTWGWSRTAVVSMGIVAMGWSAEFVGSRTGVPFGRYRYTDRLQPQIGHVPIAIPLAWLMMLPPAWAVGASVSGGSLVLNVAASALAFTAWDLFLDPQMVGWDLWVWERAQGYFGIPWVNYLGWLMVSGLMSAILRPGNLPLGPLQLIYALTWLLETVGLGIIWKKPGPAVCGFLGMGSMLAWAWLSTR